MSNQTRALKPLEKELSCVKNQVDVILAVGGGSTIDCSKAIAAGFYSEEDIWTVIAARKGILVLLYQS